MTVSQEAVLIWPTGWFGPATSEQSEYGRFDS